MNKNILKKCFLWTTAGLLALGSLSCLSAKTETEKENEVEMDNMPSMKSDPCRGEGVKAVKGFEWLPYELAPMKKKSRYILVEATGLFCENCSRDVRKALRKLNSIRKVKVESSSDVRLISWVHIWYRGDNPPSDAEISETIKSAGYTVQKIHRPHVIVAEITGAFSSMCQGVIRKELKERYGDKLDDVAVEISQKGREGISKVRMRIIPNKKSAMEGKPSLTKAQIQNSISKYGLNIKDIYTVDATK